MHPEALLEKLKLNVSAKTQQTLDAIYTICKEQQERGINDFSIATIARLGHNRGVPKAQSLRNKSAEKYQALIKSFGDTKPNAEVKTKLKKSDDWIEEITNPKHKLLVKIQASELRDAKQKINEMIPPATRIDVYDHKTMAPSETNKLTTLERKALEYIISEPFRKKWYLSPSEYGELLDEQGRVVFKPATIDAIKKALDKL